MAEHISSTKFYLLIWAILMILMALTAGVSRFDLGWANAPIAMAIAATKAALVALFFMHMRWSDKVTRIAGVAAMLWLAIMFVLTCADFFTRYGVLFPKQ